MAGRGIPWAFLLRRDRLDLLQVERDAVAGRTGVRAFLSRARRLFDLVGFLSLEMSVQTAAVTRRFVYGNRWTYERTRLLLLLLLVVSLLPLLDWMFTSLWSVFGEESSNAPERRIAFDQRLTEKVIAVGDGERLFEKHDRRERVEKEVQRVVQVANGQRQVAKADVDDVHLEIELNAADGRGEQPVPADLVGHGEGDERERDADEHDADVNATRAARTNPVAKFMYGDDAQGQDENRRENVDEEDLNRADDLVGFREEEKAVVDFRGDDGQA